MENLDLSAALAQAKRRSPFASQPAAYCLSYLGCSLCPAASVWHVRQTLVTNRWMSALTNFFSRIREDFHVGELLGDRGVLAAGTVTDLARHAEQVGRRGPLVAAGNPEGGDVALHAGGIAIVLGRHVGKGLEVLGFLPDHVLLEMAGGTLLHADVLPLRRHRRHEGHRMHRPPPDQGQHTPIKTATAVRAAVPIRTLRTSLTICNLLKSRPSGCTTETTRRVALPGNRAPASLRT